MDDPPRRSDRSPRRPLLAWTATSPAEATRARALADNYLFSGFVP